uniref:NADH-ubiquinone oxidoreductase chain 2 n=1 Tax=Chikila fulleri TaxID=928324 RepID=R4H0G3_CHIFU|nr:NADH dehydrogenase subunit 2 [Chikila fulleri]ADR03257.1 NADH dehydrogenase subunit 2 [Chikila fulleri]
MSPLTLAMMTISLITGTTITLSSSHWLLAWIGLEINTLAIIPLMINQHHPRATEATTKYFLTQAAASTLLLFTTMMNAWTTGEWEIKEMQQLPSNMMTIALAMKLGLAPLHFWLPDVLQGLNLTTGLILSTWQKLAPMALIYIMYSSLNPYLMTTMAMISTMIGGWGGLNQTQLRKMMAYSSIAHLGWMMIIMISSPYLAMLNFTIYLIMTTAMFMMMKYMNSTKINQLSTSWTKTPMLATTSSLALLSLGGLPPTTGFIPKWLILNELTKQYTTTIATIMALLALLSLFFYLRLSYSLALTQSPHTTNSTTIWRHKLNYHTTLMTLSITLTLMLLPLTPNLV